MGWSGGRVFYNRRPKPSAPFSGWSAPPVGGTARCITNGVHYPKGTQKGVGDVTPDGKHALVTVERAHDHPGAPVGTYLAAPGIGTWNDLWLQTVDGKTAWKLIDLNGRADALIWPRFDRTGRRVVWAELWKLGHGFGSWRLHVGDLTWPGDPMLTVTATLKTDGLVEPYGFTPDDRVLFAADALAGVDSKNLQMLTLPATLKGKPQRLSPAIPAVTSDWSNYNEFAFVMPGDERVIFARSVGAFYMSLEYWTMRLDGSDAQQLTSFSIPWSRWYGGFPSLAGGLAFDPANPKRFVAGIQTSYTGDYKSVLVTLK